MPRRVREPTTHGRELHEVVRDKDGRIAGVLRPAPPDLSGVVLDHARNDGVREGYEQGAQAGATAAAQAYAEAGWRAGLAKGVEVAGAQYQAGLEDGFAIGAEYQRLWPKGGGPDVADLLRAKTDGSRRREQATKASNPCLTT